jgi:hypothetical protein
MSKALGWCVLGVLAGLVVMFLLIAGIEMLGHRLYPPPPGIDPRNTADIAALLSVAPMGALGMIVVAWVVGAFGGGAVAAKVSRYWPRTAAVIVACVVVLGVVVMIRTMPHPRWMGLLGVLLPVPAALAGAWLARPRRAIPSL